MNLNTFSDFLGITNSKATEPGVSTKPIFDPTTLGEKKVLMQWESDSRVERKGFNKKFTRTMIVLIVVVALLLAIMQEFFLILAIGSLVFISYALAKTAPEKVSITLSTHGLTYDDKFYYWAEFKQFFFNNQEGVLHLIVDTNEKLPGRLYILCNPTDQDKIKEIFSRYLPLLDKIPETSLDKTYKNLLSKINFDAK